MLDLLNITLILFLIWVNSLITKLQQPFWIKSQGLLIWQGCHMGLNQFGRFPEFLVSCTDETEFNKAYFLPTHVTEYVMLLLHAHTGNSLKPFLYSFKEGMYVYNRALERQSAVSCVFFTWRTCINFPTNTMGLSLTYLDIHCSLMAKLITATYILSLQWSQCCT
jgi:hypothetical protein